MNDNWTRVIADPPFDTMGAEFSDIFSAWLGEQVSFSTHHFDGMVFDLFRKRLDLARKHNTWFATQMADGVWKDRYAGLGFAPCYSFAIRGLERTKRFHRWAEATFAGRLPDSFRIWDTDYAPLPPPSGRGRCADRQTDARLRACLPSGVRRDRRWCRQDAHPRLQREHLPLRARPQQLGAVDA